MKYESKRMKQLSELLASLPEPKGGEDQILFDGESKIKLKLMWNCVRVQGVRNDSVLWIWKCYAPRCMSILMWKCLNNGPITEEFLQHRGVQLASRCAMCKEATESGNHTLFSCHLVKDVWLEVWSTLKLDFPYPYSLLQLGNSKGTENQLAAILTVAGIWMCRNRAMFDGI